jgi:hypothetical protein
MREPVGVRMSEQSDAVAQVRPLGRFADILGLPFIWRMEQAFHEADRCAWFHVFCMLL